ncbi:DNA methyltransferase [Tissierella sp. Yu-01]|uniref:TRM11 family SAM-dependent methyltransferase n=1 Tax=Tissierella sp. Yu-01 TaxID=3035694 RepID=UPI00240D68C6|nr:DNA methyltransferase [Tissierella sp. Yu-01]WFA10070.1 DNA methyltransferase [Tissierella sp. Yu-01]
MIFKSCSNNTFSKNILHANEQSSLSINLCNSDNIISEDGTGYNSTTPSEIKEWEPKDFKMEATTVWSFKDRGKWATHSGKYRGNWSPYIPRNLILRYSKEGDFVLDPFFGSGTTLVETKLLKRKGIGIDINIDAINIAKENLRFNRNNEYEPTIYHGDSRNLEMLPNESIDLICAHPPYANIIKYSENIDGDLSLLDINEFLIDISKVTRELYRVLKNDKYCAILIGDTRRNKHMVPLGFYVMQEFLKAGFVLKENIIKEQHNCQATGFWYKKSIDYNFLLIAHEYLFVFRKP